MIGKFTQSDSSSHKFGFVPTELSKTQFVNNNLQITEIQENLPQNKENTNENKILTTDIEQSVTLNKNVEEITDIYKEISVEKIEELKIENIVEKKETQKMSQIVSQVLKNMKIEKNKSSGWSSI